MNTATEVYNHFHYAAAVLATYDPATLRPVGPSPEDSADAESAREDLLIDSSPTPSAGAGRWRLDPDVRRAVLRTMGSRAAMQVALAANPDGAEGTIQQMLTAVIRNQLPALETLTVEQLSSLIQVTEWLDGILAGLPALPDLHSRFEQVMLLEPFRRLGGEHFRGRRKQLASLRAFVGVLDPITAQPQERDRRIAASEQAGSNLPRLIYAPGGQGKSALIARFIYEHATLPTAERFPWVYLDFDRPMLHPQSPHSLLSEGTLQLGLQYPFARDAVESIRADWRERVERYAATGRPEQDSWEALLVDFQNLLAQLRIVGDPLLFVLDTFEQVQARPEQVVSDLMRFLHRLQETTPQVRLLISGRGSLRHNPPLPEFPEWKFDEELLGPFDGEEATGYLEGRGLLPAEAASVAAQVTVRTPLALVLAADLWYKRVAAGESGPLLGDSAEAAAAAELFGYTLRHNEIEGILFGRILLRVDDPDVRKLAYPGLVLRRITPELIREVLARHCSVDLPTPARAGEIYDAMRREVQLVTEHSTASGPSLRHRPELRSMMVRLMQEAGGEARARMDAIEEDAIKWYGKRADPESRGELVYHLLRRRRPTAELDAVWYDNPVELTWPDDVLEELSPAERAWLRTRLGFTLSAEERAAAGLDAWERDTGRQGRELLGGRPAAVLQLLAERRGESGSRYMGASPLYELEAEAYEKLGDWATALEAITAGLEAAAAANSRYSALNLYILRMRIAARMADREAFAESADRAWRLAGWFREGGASTLIRVAATEADSLATIQGSGPGNRDLPAALETLRRQLAAAGPPEAAMKMLPPELAALCGYLLADVDQAVVWAAVNAAGLPADTAGLRRLSVALAAWDREVSQARNQPPGTLTRRLELPQSGRLEERWTRAVLDRSPQGTQDLLHRLFAEFQDVPPYVVAAVASLLGRRAVALGQEVASRRNTENAKNVSDRTPLTDVRGSDESANDQSYIQPPRHLTGPQIKELYDALAHSFSRDELVSLLAYRFDTNLYAITSDKSLYQTLFDVIQYFNRRNQIVEFVAAALDTRPNEPRLLEFAAQLDLTVENNSERLTRFITAANSFVDVNAFRSRLGQLEGRICRIEIASQFHGLGFLVGPNLVLTTGSTVSRLTSGNMRYEVLQMRFSVRRVAGGQLSRGVTYRLAGDWLLGWGGEARVLDYALLRTEGTPGYDPVAGDGAQAASVPRGWLPLSVNLPKPKVGAGLAVLSCVADQPLRLYLGANAVDRYDARGTRLYYRLPRAPEALIAPGAPIFTADLELAAMRVDSPIGKSRGIVLGVVAARLLEIGLGYLLQDPDALTAKEGQVKSVVQGIESTQPVDSRLDVNSGSDVNSISDVDSGPVAQQPTDSGISALLIRARQLLESSGSEAALMLYTQAITQAADEATRTGDTTEESGARLELAHIYFQIGEYSLAQEMAHKALSLYHAAGNRIGEASALNLLGMICAVAGDNRRAVELHEQQLVIMRESGDRRGEAVALGSLGNASYSLGDSRSARALYEQKLGIARELGDRSAEADALGSLGLISTDLGDNGRAAELYTQQLTLVRELGDRRAEANALGNLGLAYVGLGQAARAAELYEQQWAIGRELGDFHEQSYALGNLGLVNVALGETKLAQVAFERAIQLARKTGDRLLKAKVDWALGILYEQAGDFARAGELLQAAAAYEQEVGHPDAAKHADYLADDSRLRCNFDAAQRAAQKATYLVAEGQQPADQALATAANARAAEQQLAAGRLTVARLAARDETRSGEAGSGLTRTLGLASTGVRIDAALVMAGVPTAVYPLLTSDEFPLVRCAIGTTAAQQRLRVTTQIEGYSATAVNTLVLRRSYSGPDTLFFQQPPLLAGAVRRLTHDTLATLTLTIEDLETNRVDLQKTLRVWLLPPHAAPFSMFDSTGGTHDLSRFLGAFVTPNDETLLQFLRRAAATRPVLRHAPGPKKGDFAVAAHTQAQVEAICAALAEDLRIAQVPTLREYHAGAGMINSRVRLPPQVLTGLVASATDLALLLASLLEALAINAALVVSPTQVLVAWEAEPDSGQWLHLDPGLLAGGFAGALRNGGNLAKLLAERRASAGDESWYRRWPLRELRGVHRIYPVAI